FFGLFGPYVAPHSPYRQDLSSRLLPPCWMEGGQWTHPFGTDDFGRDLASRLIYGARISLWIGCISVGLSLLAGLLLGSLAGYFGGFLDGLIMFLINILLSLPSILLAIVIVAILGPSLQNAIIAIGIVNIPTYTRLVRAQVLQEKEKEYVIASRISGSSHGRQIFWVILPNAINPVIVQATMGFGSAILEAAGLSFLSLGAQPPTPEWGAMLNDTLQFLFQAPWIVILPGTAIFLSVMSFNLLGDGLMEVLDPKGKKGLT
ncbi:MAG: ABC transporter permease, partial [Planctomycetota bacterium]